MCVSRWIPAIFWPFSAFPGRLGGLKDPLEVRVEDKICRTIHGTHLEGILSQKNWTGLAGGVKNVCVTLDSTLCPFVRDTVVPPLSTVMSRLRWDISLVIRISTITERFGYILGMVWACFG